MYCYCTVNKLLLYCYCSYCTVIVLLLQLLYCYCTVTVVTVLLLQLLYCTVTAMLLYCTVLLLYCTITTRLLYHYCTVLLLYCYCTVPVLLLHCYCTVTALLLYCYCTCHAYCNALAAEALDPLYKYPRRPTSDAHRHDNKNDSVRFGVLTALLVKIQMFCNLLLCLPLDRQFYMFQRIKVP